MQHGDPDLEALRTVNGSGHVTPDVTRKKSVYIIGRKNPKNSRFVTLYVTKRPKNKMRSQKMQDEGAKLAF